MLLSVNQYYNLLFYMNFQIIAFRSMFMEKSVPSNSRRAPGDQLQEFLLTTVLT